MRNLDKYKGVFPAFYACYDDNGEISPDRIRMLAQHYRDVGVKGLYVGGSSGECIYQSLDERKLVLETVMEAVGEELTIIAHVACPSTRDSVALAKHAESLKVDAISAVPPYYFVLDDLSIDAYWSAMIDATALDFIIYNIPGTTNYTLTIDLFKTMINKDKVVGVKNSSMPVQDIYLFKANTDKEIIVFNGPDEQFVAGRVMGADSGIGGTYGVMPELFLAANDAIENEQLILAREIQYAIDNVIFTMLKAEGHLYDVIKEILRLNGLNIGQARLPLRRVTEKDQPIITEANNLIKEAVEKYIG